MVRVSRSRDTTPTGTRPGSVARPRTPGPAPDGIPPEAPPPGLPHKEPHRGIRDKEQDVAVLHDRPPPRPTRRGRPRRRPARRGRGAAWPPTPTSAAAAKIPSAAARLIARSPRAGIRPDAPPQSHGGIGPSGSNPDCATGASRALNPAHLSAPCRPPRRSPAPDAVRAWLAGDIDRRALVAARTRHRRRPRRARAGHPRPRSSGQRPRPPAYPHPQRPPPRSRRRERWRRVAAGRVTPAGVVAPGEIARMGYCRCPIRGTTLRRTYPRFLV